MYGDAYPYEMGKPRDDKDAAQDLARDLSALVGELAGEGKIIG
jgi:hypothetical protein